MTPMELEKELYSSINDYVERIKKGMDQQYEYIKKHEKSWKKWEKLQKKENKLERKGKAEEEIRKIEEKKKKFTVKPLDCLPSKCDIPSASVSTLLSLLLVEDRCADGLSDGRGRSRQRAAVFDYPVDHVEEAAHK